MTKLTPDQAKVIAAYTGYLIGDFHEMHGYIEEKLSRPVFVHEMADKDFQKELRTAVKADFLSLNPDSK